MFRDRDRCDDRSFERGIRKLFEIKLYGLAEIAKRFLDAIAFARRPRLGIECNVTALGSSGKDCGGLHNAKLTCDVEHDKLLNGWRPARFPMRPTYCR